MKRRKPSDVRKDYQGSKVPGLIVNSMLALSAISVVALGGIFGYYLGGVGGMIMGIFVGSILAGAFVFPL